MEQTLSTPNDGALPATTDSLVINDSAFFLSLSVLGFTLAAVTTVGNAALLLTIFLDPRRLLETPPSLLIVNLSVSDLVVGLVACNLVAVKDLYHYQNLPVPDELDQIIRLVLGLSLFVSSGMIIALSYDRFFAVVHTFKYAFTVTKKRVKIFIVAVWAVSLVLCFLTLASIPERKFDIAYAQTYASLPAVSLTVMYIKVFRALRRRTRELRHAGITSMMRSKKVLDRERNMVLTILIILALFYATVLPEYIVLHLRHFCGSCARSLIFEKLVIAFFRLRLLNSAVNPFLYAWRLVKYRKAFLAYFAKLCKSSTTQTSQDRTTCTSIETHL